MSGRRLPSRPRVAFVLGGGGPLGAVEVGMLQALLERGIAPDLVVGTSVGALNGAVVAADPTPAAAERLRAVWTSLDDRDVFGGSLVAGAAHLVRNRIALHSNRGLRQLIDRVLPARRFEELRVPFQCVAACVERAAEHWFSTGPLVDAILASCAVPGVLPPVAIGGEHFLDGGIVNSIPIGRAVELGAEEIFVLHVGRIERPLAPPRTAVEVAFVAFEIARRHRFARDLASLPPGVRAHVLPTGQPKGGRALDLSQLSYWNFKAVAGLMDRAYRATRAYLASEVP